MKKHRGKFIALAVLIAMATIYWVVIKKVEENQIMVLVEEGSFDVTVLNTGELRAKNYTEISAPSALRQVGIWQVKISNLVAEGTVVKEGEFVAELDNTEIMNKINEEHLNVQKKQS